MVRVGMIGGSGFDDPDFLTDVEYIKKGTPFGRLSSDLIVGKAGEGSRHNSATRKEASRLSFGRKLQG